MSVTHYNRQREHERVKLMIELSFGKVVNMEELQKLEYKDIELLSRDIFYYAMTKDNPVIATELKAY